MKVEIELISPLSVATGCTEPFTWELEENATGRTLIRALSEQLKAPPAIHGAMAAGGLMLLVNQEYVKPDTVLKEGDQVSVILRISGI